MYQIGMRYLNGDGVHKDEALAARMLISSADGGDLDATIALGMMYYSGTGVPCDHVSAMSFFKRAALQWSPLGIFMIGLMYYNGEGVDVMRGRGIGLIKLAAEIGSVDAADFLRDNMISRSTPCPSERSGSWRRSTGTPGRRCPSRTCPLREGRGRTRSP